MKILLTLYIILTSLNSTAPSAWTKWETTPCYDKIEFRYRHLRAQGARHVFEVQFKNRYERTIYFDYALADAETKEGLDHARRTSLPARRESKSISVFTNTEEFVIVVGQLSFSPYSTDYEACDDKEGKK